MPAETAIVGPWKVPPKARVSKAGPPKPGSTVSQSSSREMTPPISSASQIGGCTIDIDAEDRAGNQIHQVESVVIKVMDFIV